MTGLNAQIDGQGAGLAHAVPLPSAVRPGQEAPAAALDYGPEVAARLHDFGIDPRWLNRMLETALQVADRHGVPCPYPARCDIQYTGEIRLIVPADITYEQAARLSFEFALEMFTVIPDFPAQYIAATIDSTGEQ